MTLPPTPPPPRPVAAVRPAPYSILAILSVAALIVPILGPIMSMMLGVAAIVRMRHREMRGVVPMRGRRLAYIGCGFGAVLLLVESYACESLSRTMRARIDAQVTVAVTDLLAVSDDRAASAALVLLSDDAAEVVTRQDALTFANEARQRYGAFQSMSMVASNTSEMSLKRHEVSASIDLRFEGGHRLGSVVFVVEPNSQSAFEPRSRVAELVIEDRERGQLRLGRIAAPQEPATQAKEPAHDG